MLFLMFYFPRILKYLFFNLLRVKYKTNFKIKFY